MKEKLFLATAALVVAMLFAFRHGNISQSTPGSFNLIEYKKRNIISCSPDWVALKGWIEEADIPPIPGAGTYKWKIHTADDSAQFYFNQGINMYYSFHIIEAMASFKKAAKFDPGCAMLYWAQALAYGPNINDLGYTASPDALKAIEQATELMKSIPEKEKRLINAQKSRYSSDSLASREKLNQLYADNMKDIYQQYPDDADVAALYADALMLQHPWDLWKIDGTPKPWTPTIREILEELLTKSPNHPGANHYYIHVMEPSPYAAKALPSANRLGKLTPGLSHTVHMPSHIYLRTGNYEKGINVNEAAIKSYNKTIPLYAPVTGADFLYIIHNLHMQTNHAMLAGSSAYSVSSAIETRNSISKDYLSIPGALGNYIQYIYMTPVLVNIRFGNWNTLLEEAQPDPSMRYANILYHFGRGMAFIQKSQVQDAKKELQSLNELMSDSSLSIPLTPFSPAIDGATIAENILSGSVALKEKKNAETIAFFEKAVSIEDGMVYNEPRDWLLNPKHYLANAYLKSGHPDKARIILEKDLQNNNENGWALFGCWQALKAENNKAGADKMLSRFKAAFQKADTKLYGPVF